MRLNSKMRFSSFNPGLPSAIQSVCRASEVVCSVCTRAFVVCFVYLPLIPTHTHSKKHQKQRKLAELPEWDQVVFRMHFGGLRSCEFIISRAHSRSISYVFFFVCSRSMVAVSREMGKHIKFQSKDGSKKVLRKLENTDKHRYGCWFNFVARCSATEPAF